ncbi:MAG: hypothetical protein IT285_07520 [Bdellovibrionales bacterium]|nr:hypothetical protein [Bdellovibrionales bacterium]
MMKINPPAYHFSARHSSAEPLQDQNLCSEAWRSLRAVFPDAIAAVLMPDHLHLIVTTIPPELARLRLRRILSAMERQPGQTPGWQLGTSPRVVDDLEHLRRQVRYVHLNPCRARLASDPLAWRWSTHWDWLSVTAPAWGRPQQWAARLGFHTRERFHEYVSSDPTCVVSGSRPPEYGLPDGRVGLAEIQAAAARALRLAPGAKLSPLARRWSAHAARRWTDYRPAQIGRGLGLDDSAGQRLLLKPGPGRDAWEALRAQILDPRLRALG